MDQPKFNKSFEALYAIAMKMADECIVNKPLSCRFEKLTEEYNEVIEAYGLWAKHSDNASTNEYVVDELADLLFILLHIAHKIDGTTGFQLLHKAMTKMLSRMNDSNYVAKN